MKWIKTKFPGVRYRDSDTRRNKGKPDRYYSIRYSKEGRSIEEPAGWESGGMTPLVASQRRADWEKYIQEKHLSPCLFPDKLVDAGGEFHQPPSW